MFVKPPSDGSMVRFEGFHSTYLYNCEIFTKTSNKSECLAKEAEELERCKNLNIRTENAIPSEFISYDSVTNTLTVKYINDSKSLFNILWNNGSFIAKYLKRDDTFDKTLLLERCHQLGIWLRKYHLSSSDQRCDLSVIGVRLEDYYNQKENRIREKVLINERRLNNYRRSFYGILEKVKKGGRQYLKENDAFCCIIHGDYIPYNIVIDGDMNARVVDFGSSCTGINLEDVGRFYELLFAAGNLFGTGKYFHQVADAFLSGYQLSKTALDSELMAAIRAYNGLTHCIAAEIQRSYDSIFSRFLMKRITNSSLAWMDKHKYR